MDEDKLAIEVYKWLVKNLGFEDTEESFIKWKKGMLEMTEMNKKAKEEYERLHGNRFKEIDEGEWYE